MSGAFTFHFEAVGGFKTHCPVFVYPFQCHGNELIPFISVRNEENRRERREELTGEKIPESRQVFIQEEDLCCCVFSWTEKSQELHMSKYPDMFLDALCYLFVFTHLSRILVDFSHMLFSIRSDWLIFLPSGSISFSNVVHLSIY